MHLNCVCNCDVCVCNLCRLHTNGRHCAKCFTRSLWKSSIVAVQSLVLSNSLRLHGLQNARLPCRSPSPGANYVHWVSDAIQPSHPLSSPSLPAFNLSQHQSLLQWGGSSYQVAKVLELQLQHQSFSEYSGLISFRIDWFDFLAVQGTLKSLL